MINTEQVSLLLARLSFVAPPNETPTQRTLHPTWTHQPNILKGNHHVTCNTPQNSDQQQ